MKYDIKRFGAVLMVLALALAGAGNAMAAAGTIETGTDTTEQVFMSDGKTIETDFNGSDSIDYTLALNDTAMTADEIAMNITTSDGVEVYSFSGTWDDWDAGDAAGNDYQHNVSGGDLAYVPMNINENVTLTVQYWNESKTDANQNPTNITVYIENGDERSVQRVTEDAAAADVDDDAKVPLYKRADFWDDDNEFTMVEVDDSDVEVNGSATDVFYVLGDDTTTDAFANTTEDLSDSGAFTFMLMDVDADEDGKVPVFYKDSPDWYDAEDHGTYAVYNPSDDVMEIHTEDTEFEDATTADITFSNDVYRVTDIYTVWKLSGGYDGGGVDAIMAMV